MRLSADEVRRQMSDPALVAQQIVTDEERVGLHKLGERPLIDRMIEAMAPSLASASTPVAIVSGGASGFGASAPVLAAKYTGGGASQPTTLASATTVVAAMLVWLI
jgi:hypothetical protein